MASQPNTTLRPQKQQQLLKAVGLTIWVLLSFFIAQLLALGLWWVLDQLGVVARLNESVAQTLFAATVYVIMMAVVIGLPWLIQRSKTTLDDMGLNLWPRWVDLLLVPAGMVVYVVLSGILMVAAQTFLPWFDIEQAQDTGFSQLYQRSEFMLAFVTLVIIAPVAEELVFRGYLYGKLKRYTFRWLAIILTSVLFALVHGQWNVAVDVFALSIVLCILRDISGSVWPAVLVHMAKNGIAFYIIFINPLVSGTL